MNRNADGYAFKVLLWINGALLGILIASAAHFFTLSGTYASLEDSRETRKDIKSLQLDINKLRLELVEIRYGNAQRLFYNEESEP